MRPLIAFDADDTLWHNESLYQEAESRFRQLMLTVSEPENTSARLFATEMRNLNVYGYGVKSFMLSMLETALELSGGALACDLAGQIIALGQQMLQAEVELVEGVERVIIDLAQDHRLMIITKGDLLDQHAKLRRSGLSGYFQHVEVVNHKNIAIYREILARHNIAPKDFIMVGNSLRSDILPVLELGGTAIYIPYPLLWQHEHVEDADLTSDRFHELASITELPALIQNLLDGWAPGLEKSDFSRQQTETEQLDPVGQIVFSDPGRFIRAISICVIRKDSRILVFRSRGPSGEREFYRPLGGGINPGESSLNAVVREMREELGIELVQPRLLGVLENIFTYNGKPGHEVVFVYAAEFADSSLYEREEFVGREDDGTEFEVVWVEMENRTENDPPVYPKGLRGLIYP